ncbi:MAG TPA: hypothetical protein VGJ84_02160 [Polyangiaceae bacterium]
MITRLTRGAVELIVALFALLGFLFVPLGKRTAFEHTKAIFTTDAAQRAGRELQEATIKVRNKLVEGLATSPKPNGPLPQPPPLPSSPRHSPKSSHSQGSTKGGTPPARIAWKAGPPDASL